MPAKNLQTEKRRDLRVKMSKPLVVKFQIKKTRAALGLMPRKPSQVENLSVGGMKMELPVLERRQIDNIIEGKEKLVLELNFSFLKKPIKVVGRPVWLRRKDKGGKVIYVLGVSFEEISENERETILGQLVNACLNYGCAVD